MAVYNDFINIICYIFTYYVSIFFSFTLFIYKNNVYTRIVYQMWFIIFIVAIKFNI